MTSILVEGSRFDRGISHAEIETIKNAQSIHDVTSAWGHIQDWFCGTRKEQAKQDLFIFMNKDREGSERLAAFNQLYKQVAAPYKDNFDYEILDDNRFVVLIALGKAKLELEIDQSGLDRLSGIVAEIEQERNIRAYKPGSNGVEQLERDIHRQNCSFYGGGLDLSYKVGDKTPPEVKYDAARKILARCVNDYQRNMLNVLATQCGVLDLIGMKTKEDKRFASLGDRCCFNIDVHKLFSGNVRVDIVFENTIPSEERYKNLLDLMSEDERIYNRIQIAASFLIGKDKTVCLNADYSHVA